MRGDCRFIDVITTYNTGVYEKTSLFSGQNRGWANSGICSIWLTPSHMKAAERLALSYYPFNKPHSYLLLRSRRRWTTAEQPVPQNTLKHHLAHGKWLIVITNTSAERSPSAKNNIKVNIRPNHIGSPSI
jgi:hypothetical protein